MSSGKFDIVMYYLVSLFHNQANVKEDRMRRSEGGVEGRWRTGGGGEERGEDAICPLGGGGGEEKRQNVLQ